MSTASVAQRMSWAADRETTRVEDMAYSLLGIFNINMPLLYGEGLEAFRRLQLEIITNSGDTSIFAWERYHLVSSSAALHGSMLAERVKDFCNSGQIRSVTAMSKFILPHPAITVTNVGLLTRWPVLRKYGYTIAVLPCQEGAILTETPLLSQTLGVRVDLVQSEDKTKCSRSYSNNRVRHLLYLTNDDLCDTHIEPIHLRAERYINQDDKFGVHNVQMAMVNFPTETNPLILKGLRDHPGSNFFPVVSVGQIVGIRDQQWVDLGPLIEHGWTVVRFELIPFGTFDLILGCVGCRIWCSLTKAMKPTDLETVLKDCEITTKTLKEGQSANSHFLRSFSDRLQYALSDTAQLNISIKKIAPDKLRERLRAFSVELLNSEEISGKHSQTRGIFLPPSCLLLTGTPMQEIARLREKFWEREATGKDSSSNSQPHVRKEMYTSNHLFGLPIDEMLARLR
jgi:hypothetical protein